MNVIETRDLTRRFGDFVAVKINSKLVYLQNMRLGGCTGGSAQYGPHPNHHLLRVKWLGNVIIRAKIKADQLIRVFYTGGEHDNGQVGQRLIGPNDAGYFPAIPVGQH